MDWLQRVTDSLATSTGLDSTTLALSDDEREILLDVARLASHASGDRRNAPLLCYVLGMTAGRGVALARAAGIATEHAEAEQT